MILPPRHIVEPEIADLSALNSTTMRPVEVLRACGRASCSPQAGLWRARLCPCGRSS